MVPDAKNQELEARARELEREIAKLQQARLELMGMIVLPPLVGLTPNAETLVRDMYARGWQVGFEESADGLAWLFQKTIPDDRMRSRPVSAMSLDVFKAAQLACLYAGELRPLSCINPGEGE